MSISKFSAAAAPAAVGASLPLANAPFGVSCCGGIGAAELAAVWMGWKNLFHCEVDGFCNKMFAASDFK